MSINIFFGLGSGVVAAVAYGVVPVIGAPAPAAATASLNCALCRLAANACARLGAIVHHASVPQQGARVRALLGAPATRGRGGGAAGQLCPVRSTEARVVCRAAQAAMLRDIAQENGRSLEAQRKVCPRDTLRRGRSVHTCAPVALLSCKTYCPASSHTWRKTGRTCRQSPGPLAGACAGVDRATWRALDHCCAAGAKCCPVTSGRTLCHWPASGSSVRGAGDALRRLTRRRAASVSSVLFQWLPAYLVESGNLTSAHLL